MNDLQSVARGLASLRSDLSRTTPHLEEAVYYLEQVLADLSKVDDIHARNAEVDVRIAISDLRQACSVWVPNFDRCSKELERSIVS